MEQPIHCKLYTLTGNCTNKQACKFTHQPPTVYVQKKLALRSTGQEFIQEEFEKKVPEPKPVPSTSSNQDQKPKLRAGTNDFRADNNAFQKPTIQEHQQQQDMSQQMFYDPNQHYNNSTTYDEYQQQMQYQYSMMQQMMQGNPMMMMNQFGGGNDMMNMQNMMNQFGMDEYDDDDDDDEDEFVEKCSDCSCCNGFPYICKSSDFCREMDQCYCIMRIETEEKMNEDSNKMVEDSTFREDLKDCSCCKGFVFDCKGHICQDLGACHCIVN